MSRGRVTGGTPGSIAARVRARLEEDPFINAAELAREIGCNRAMVWHVRRAMEQTSINTVVSADLHRWLKRQAKAMGDDVTVSQAAAAILADAMHDETEKEATT